jgi:hypothetical protein
VTLGAVTLAAGSGLLAQPGTTAFLVVFGMAVILFFVFRSMARHLRKVSDAARAEAEAAARAEGRDPTDGTPGGEI